MDVTPASGIGALVRYAVIAAGTAIGVTNEAVLVQVAAAIVAAGTAIYGYLKTRAANKTAARY